VVIGAYDQLGRTLDPGQRVRDAVAGDKGEPSQSDVTLMRRFWFDGDAQFAPIGLLSGGERRRLQLLLTLLEQPNVLLLDEPTNDLDLDTLRALEDFLDAWPGIVVAVSHDRAFLDRMSDELLALDGDGTVRWVRGGVAAWLANREAAIPASTRSVARPAAATAAAAPPPPPTRGSRSPSTVRRQLGQTERDLATATAARDAVAAELAAASGHEQLTTLSQRLAAAQSKVDAAEEQWLRLATEAESHGLEV
jgi:ATP-binding cassette subfamily F protein uup